MYGYQIKIDLNNANLSCNFECDAGFFSRSSPHLTPLQLLLKSDDINTHTHASSHSHIFDWPIHLRSAQKVNAVTKTDSSFLFTV